MLVLLTRQFILMGPMQTFCTALASLPPDGFWINDNGCKFVLMEGIIRSDYQEYAIPWPGRDLDPEFVYNPIRSPFGHVRDGKLFCTFSPVFALLSSVPYRLLGSYGLYLMPLLCGVLTLPAVWILTGWVAPSPRARRIAQPLSVVVAALATLWSRWAGSLPGVTPCLGGTPFSHKRGRFLLWLERRSKVRLAVD